MKKILNEKHLFPSGNTDPAQDCFCGNELSDKITISNCSNNSSILKHELLGYLANNTIRLLAVLLNISTWIPLPVNIINTGNGHKFQTKFHWHSEDLDTTLFQSEKF
jgi:hypothetical protein